MRRVVGAALVAMGIGSAVTVPAEPAGACSIYCEEGNLQLELVEVRVSRSVDPEGLIEPEVLPEWPELATMDVWGSLNFPGDEGYLALTELVDEGGE